MILPREIIIIEPTLLEPSHIYIYNQINPTIDNVIASGQN